MNRYRRATGGYTILEVIIVLTISSVLFAAAVIGYTAQNRRTQFTNSVQSFAQEIQDVLNDVEVGFYPSDNGFSCSAGPSGPPTISATGTRQGTNTSCIFVGRAINFAPSSPDPDNKSNIDIYTLVGRRLVGGPTTEPVSNLAETQPRVLNLDELIEHKSLISGLEIVSVAQLGGGTKYSGLAMVSVDADGAGGIDTGLNSRASLAVVPGDIDQPPNTFHNGIMNLDSVNVAAASNGVEICVKEGGADKRFAIIELARDRSQIIVNTKIDTPPCS